MLLDDLAAYLQAEGIGTVGTTLFKGSVPQDAPLVSAQDALVALIEGPGMGPIRPHTPRESIVEQPTLQIVVRGAQHGYPAARQKAQDVFVALDGLANVTLGTTFVLWIFALQSPFWLHTDTLNRPHIVFNIRLATALAA
jgi:hypothetical protein